MTNSFKLHVNDLKTRQMKELNDIQLVSPTYCCFA